MALIPKHAEIMTLIPVWNGTLEKIVHKDAIQAVKHATIAQAILIPHAMTMICIGTLPVRQEKKKIRNAETLLMETIIVMTMMFTVTGQTGAVQTVPASLRRPKKNLYKTAA